VGAPAQSNYLPVTRGWLCGAGVNYVAAKLDDLARLRESIRAQALAFVDSMPLTVESRRTFEQFVQELEAIVEYEDFLKKRKRK
jgi:hypothetical protein